jgi:DNA-binding NtrC family response regulator
MYILWKSVKHVRVKDNDSNVLLTGESGTGKELIARSIHISSPERQMNKFNIVDISNIPSTLLESHLFGHEKGAFTDATSKRIGVFESADKGTIFLDEIGDFPTELQVKLLRFLQEGTFSRVGSSQELSADVRIIAASNKNIEGLVKKKKFREDLYYRLNVIRIHLPPLRDRKEDIIPLIKYFQLQFENQKGRKLFFPTEIISKMELYDWPGNVRQLKNFMERLYVICAENSVTENDLLFYGLPVKGVSDKIFSSLLALPFKEARKQLLENFEKEFINHYLSLYKRNISKVASIVGESREGLSKKIKRYGLKRN